MCTMTREKRHVCVISALFLDEFHNFVSKISTNKNPSTILFETRSVGETRQRPKLGDQSVSVGAYIPNMFIGADGFMVKDISFARNRYEFFCNDSKYFTQCLDA